MESSQRNEFCLFIQNINEYMTIVEPQISASEFGNQIPDILAALEYRHLTKTRQEPVKNTQISSCKIPYTR